MSYKNSFIYLAIALLIAGAVGYAPNLFYRYHNQTDQNELITVIGKANHFQKNSKNYEIIFYGDSRTYIGIEAENITNAINKKVFNYASMAHWFETQYLQLKTIEKNLKSKKIIWIISDTSFLESPVTDKLHNIISIDISDFYRYLKIGFSITDLYQNFLLNFLPNYHLFVLQDQIHTTFNNILDKDINNTQNTTTNESCERIENSFKTSQEFTKNGSLAGCFYYKNDGQLLFVEKDDKYLRSRQQEWAKEIDHSSEFKADKKNEILFMMILELFHKNEVDLTVLRYKDSPYNYQLNSIRSNSIDRYMKHVKSKVESYGFNFLEIDFSTFTDGDYFDYNHLNSTGSSKLTNEIIKLAREYPNAF